MLNPKAPEADLLKAILEPLLDDFQYWFERSRQLLQSFLLISVSLAIAGNNAFDCMEESWKIF